MEPASLQLPLLINLLRVNTEEGNIECRDHVGSIFPFSLLTKSKLILFRISRSWLGLLACRRSRDANKQSFSVGVNKLPKREQRLQDVILGGSGGLSK